MWQGLRYSLQLILGEWAVVEKICRPLNLNDTAVQPNAKLSPAELPPAKPQPAMPVFETTTDRFEYDVVKAVIVFTGMTSSRSNGLTLLHNGMTVAAARVKSPTSDPKQ
jgi:hypothetical protein